MKIEKEFLIFKRLLGQNRARPSRTVRAQPAAAWLTRLRMACLVQTGGLLAWPTGQRDWHGAAPARCSGARVACLTVSGARTMLHRGVNGYGTSHGKVFTVSTQGTRRTHLTWLGGRATRMRKLTGAAPTLGLTDKEEVT
jgi:hypothetical protein